MKRFQEMFLNRRKQRLRRAYDSPFTPPCLAIALGSDGGLPPVQNSINRIEGKLAVESES